MFAGICGSLLGSSILDPVVVRTSGTAMLCGLMVSLLAYVLFFATSTVVVALTSDGPISSFQGWTLVFFIGSIYIGWLVALVGVVGGALLIFLQDDQRPVISSTKEK